MISPLVVARLCALGGVIFGLLHSIQPTKDSVQRPKVAPLAGLLMASIFSIIWYTAAKDIRQTAGALGGAMSGVVLNLLIVASSDAPQPRWYRGVRLVKGVLVGLLIGAYLGSSPRQALAGALPGVVIGALAGLLIPRRWPQTALTVRRGANDAGASVVLISWLSVFGAILGAVVEVGIDREHVLTTLLFG